GQRKVRANDGDRHGGRRFAAAKRSSQSTSQRTRAIDLRDRIRKDVVVDEALAGERATKGESSCARATDLHGRIIEERVSRQGKETLHLEITHRGGPEQRAKQKVVENRVTTVEEELPARQAFRPRVPRAVDGGAYLRPIGDEPDAGHCEPGRPRPGGRERADRNGPDVFIDAVEFRSNE